MTRWRISYIGRRLEHLGIVEAENESDAIEAAVSGFEISPVRRSKLAVMRLPDAKRE